MTRLHTFCVSFLLFYSSSQILGADIKKISSIDFIRKVTLKNLNTLASSTNDEEGSKLNFRFGGDTRTIPFDNGLVWDLLIMPVQRSKCGAWDSCVLRCGDQLLGAPYLCACDEDCLKYDDCCIDFKYYCGAPANSTEPEVSTTTENILAGQVSPELGFEIMKKKTDYDCFNVSHFETSSYGIWHDLDGIPMGRKCMLKTPEWCEPGNYDQFEWDFTQSLSILLNFGPEGWNNDILFSSDYYDPNKCPSIWEIWDPFTSICRQISCNPEYELEDGKCVWDGEGPRPPIKDESFLKFQTKTANITFYGNVLKDREWTSDVLTLLQADIIESLSRRIRVNASRFSNLVIEKDEQAMFRPLRTTTELPINQSFKIPPNDNTPPGYEDDPLWISTEEGFPVIVNFTLARKQQNSTHELTIEQLLSVLHEAVAIRAVLLSNEGPTHLSSDLVPMKINGVYKCVEQEEINFFQKWCRGGDLLTYWNEEFVVDFVFKDQNFTELYMQINVTETNKTYEQGQYIANLLHQSSDMTADAVNVSGVVMVCENRPLILDDSCPRIPLNDTEFEMQEDGTLIYNGEIPGIGPRLNRSEYEFTATGEILTCVNYDEAKRELEPEDPTLLEKFASGITMTLIILSLLGLLGTMFTYGLFPELRTLPGHCLIHLCVGEFVFFLLFILGVRRSTAETDAACTFVAITLHLSSLTFFCWSSVISYDLFQTFAKFQAVSRSREKYLWRYAIAGYGIPMLIVFISLMVEFHSDVDIGYGSYAVCWIENSMAALYIFALPILVSILVNLFFFILTVRGIRQVSKMCATRNIRQKSRARFTLYMKMSSVQCFSWIFGFLTVLTHFSYLTSKIFEFIFLTSSAIQGLYVFFAFVVNQRVFSLYKGLWSGKRGGDFDSDQSIIGGSKRSTMHTTIRRNSSQLDSPEGGNGVKKDKVIPQKGHRVVSRTDVEGGGKRQNGHQNQVAERTVSNETCQTSISSDSD